jgi:hypothetical protein
MEISFASNSNHSSKTLNFTTKKVGEYCKNLGTELRLLKRRELVDKPDPHDLRSEWPCRSFGLPPGAWRSNPAVPALLHRDGIGRKWPNGGNGFCSEQLKL